MEPNNPFTGTGLFTGEHPLTALELAGKADWVAVQSDQINLEVAEKLKAAGFKLVIWEDEASQRGVDAVNQYGAVGYIAQAEGPGQYQAAQNIADKIPVPKAMVTNLDMRGYEQSWDNRWICMPEAYQNVNPNASPDRIVASARNFGADTVIPVFGVYDGTSEGGGKMPLKEYLADSKGSYAVFTAETLATEDTLALSRGGATGAVASLAQTDPDNLAGEEPLREPTSSSSSASHQDPVIEESSSTAAGGHIVDDNSSTLRMNETLSHPNQASVVPESSHYAGGGHVAVEDDNQSDTPAMEVLAPTVVPLPQSLHTPASSVHQDSSPPAGHGTKNSHSSLSTIEQNPPSNGAAFQPPLSTEDPTVDYGADNGNNDSHYGHVL